MNDSIDKIVKCFAAMTEQEFTYKGKLIHPKPLAVSPLLLRDFSCPPNCGACCPVFTLDYIPTEQGPNSIEKRSISLNGGFTLFSDTQSENKGTHCKYVRQEDARCSIYKNRPFSCDFELIRVLAYKDHFRLTQQLYGRAWALTKVKGNEKGALCTLHNSPSGRSEVVRKLKRLEQWMEYFGIRQNRIQKIIDAIPLLTSGEPIHFEAQGELKWTSKHIMPDQITYEGEAQ